MAPFVRFEKKERDNRLKERIKRLEERESIKR